MSPLLNYPKILAQVNLNILRGLPMPTTLALVLGMAYCVRKGFIFDNIPFGIFREDQILEFHPIILVFFIHGCGMISKSLKIPKP
ncbi:CIC_collapsed_G0015120.mRNA.1.CDS.1 [Saccharomyces cerevisiae]|nr:CIC_collapsed_G0015120.mRNA.1.CDS.1 [Saccharomyces cerevisiae]